MRRRSAGTHVPLGAMLAAGTDIPIQVDNGANTLGQAEMWFGAGRGATDAVVALVGSGVGAALVTGGSSYRGTRSSAGEWGHTTIVYGGRQCRCGAEGCLEAYVGAEGVLERFQLANGGQPPPAATRRRPSSACSTRSVRRRSRPRWSRTPSGTSVPDSPTWSTSSTRSGSCSAAGPGCCWGSGTCRNSVRPSADTPSASRTPRSPSSCASSAGTPSRWARPPSRSSASSAKAAPPAPRRPATRLAARIR